MLKAHFKAGNPLFGKEGTFHQALQDLLNTTMESELASQLETTKPVIGNRRNGKMRRELQTECSKSYYTGLRARLMSF
jgi:hypothetical protein